MATEEEISLIFRSSPTARYSLQAFLANLLACRKLPSLRWILETLSQMLPCGLPTFQYSSLSFSQEHSASLHLCCSQQTEQISLRTSILAPWPSQAQLRATKKLLRLSSYFPVLRWLTPRLQQEPNSRALLLGDLLFLSWMESLKNYSASLYISHLRQIMAMLLSRLETSSSGQSLQDLMASLQYFRASWQDFFTAWQVPRLFMRCPRCLVGSSSKCFRQYSVARVKFLSRKQLLPRQKVIVLYQQLSLFLSSPSSLRMGSLSLRLCSISLAVSISMTRSKLPDSYISAACSVRVIFLTLIEKVLLMRYKACSCFFFSFTVLSVSQVFSWRFFSTTAAPLLSRGLKVIKMQMFSTSLPQMVLFSCYISSALLRLLSSSTLRFSSMLCSIIRLITHSKIIVSYSPQSETILPLSKPNFLDLSSA